VRQSLRADAILARQKLLDVPGVVCLTIVIDLDVEKADAILMYGARSQPLVLGTAKPVRLMAAVFKPGGGFPFVECPAAGLPPQLFSRLATRGASRA